MNFPFLWFAWGLFSPFCASLPASEIVYTFGGAFIQLIITTRTYPVMWELWNLFYDNNGKKVIKAEIYHHLSPVALAFWIMCDRTRRFEGLALCTESFSTEEVVKLINILIIRYDLSCTIHNTKSVPRIYIHPSSIPALRNIVAPHMCAFSMYKLSGMNRSQYNSLNL